MRSFCILLSLSISTAAIAEPIVGWLNGEEGDFLQYECSSHSDGTKECTFTQISLGLKQEPEEIDQIVAERLPEAIEQLQQADMSETCQYLIPVQGISKALMSGNVEEAMSLHSQMPEKAREDFDLAEAMEGLSRLDSREVADMRTMLAATAKLCDNPSQDDVEAMVRLELDKDARTCKIRLNTWKGTFRPISETIWALKSDGPEGQCGVQRLDRFECKDGRFSCEFISEKRILNPDAELLPDMSCGDLEERPFSYKHDSDGVYIDCNIVSFF